MHRHPLLKIMREVTQMLKITNLQKTFNPGTVNAKTALSGLNLTLEDGDFVTVIGGNGAGKSTMLNAIAGVWKPDFGTIEIDGVDVTTMPEHKRAKFLGRVFQDPMKGTSPDMEIAENLCIASKRGIKRRFVRGVKKQDREYYRELLKTLELGYTLPKVLTKKAAIDRVRFYINCNNLLTFTKRDGLMKNVDPESNSSGIRYYPQMKTYNFGVNVTF